MVKTMENPVDFPTNPLINYDKRLSIFWRRSPVDKAKSHENYIPRRCWCILTSTVGTWKTMGKPMGKSPGKPWEMMAKLQKAVARTAWLPQEWQYHGDMYGNKPTKAVNGRKYYETLWVPQGLFHPYTSADLRVWVREVEFQLHPNVVWIFIPDLLG